ncbi:MAG TPA: hypothetical protein VG457_14070, partial [Planctomycetota bacterium]|nr:hypothetical protein [Planctomycetota bacterium]
MTISGSTIHGQIRYALSQQGTAEAILSDRLYDCERRIARLTEEREETYTRLAKRYLPELSAETVKTTLREVQAEVARIYHDRQTRRQALEKEMVEAEVRRAKLNAELDELEDQRGVMAREIAGLKARVVEDLQGRPEYGTLRASWRAAKDEVLRVEELVGTFATRTGTRAQAYEANPVFKYLLLRGYATAAYRGGVLTGSLDAWAARKIEFHRQKAAYDVLHQG